MRRRSDSDDAYRQLAAVRRDIVIAGRVLSGAGLSRGFGHVSARVPGSARFLVTPAVALDDLQAGEIELAGSDGEVVTPRSAAGGPAEIHLHTAVYRARPDVGAIVRVQPEYLEAFGVAQATVRPLNNFGAGILGATRSYGSVMSVNTLALGEAAARSLGDGVALVLRGNGCLVVGPDVRTATVRTLWLEEAARLQWRTLILAAALDSARPAFLADDEVAQVGARLNGPRSIERTWDAAVRRWAR